MRRMRRRRRRRVLFRSLLLAARGPGPPPPTMHDAVPCGGCLLTNHSPSLARAATALETSPEMTTTISGGGRGGDAHKSEQSLLYFAGSKLSCHLRHVGAKRTEAMKGLIALLYDRVDGRFPMLDLVRIFIALGPGGRRRMRRGGSTSSVNRNKD